MIQHIAAEPKKLSSKAPQQHPMLQFPLPSIE